MNHDDGCGYCNMFQCDDQCGEAKRDKAIRIINRLSRKIGRASRGDAIVSQLLNSAFEIQNAEDVLCRIVQAQSEYCESVARDALAMANHNSVVTMVYKDSEYANKMIADNVAKETRIAQLEREISLLRSKARVRIAPGEFGGE